MLSALHDEVPTATSLRMAHLTIYCRLRASEFKTRKDQRKAINRWNKYVLGPEYIRKAAQLCPKTRECVIQEAGSACHITDGIEL
jgi:hypothetical protein